ncbi:MAG: Iron complex outerrane recepter protein, partial [Sediminibacterium sp.]|nr:Iron complex outerrane recepter protein [Sediminibacterium sp.]
MSKVIFLKHPLKLIFTVMLGCICLFPPGNAFAVENRTAMPDQTVSGTVTDGGKPLPGATVSIKGGTRNTVTDARGSFTISVPGSNSVLVVSYVGFETQEITVGTRTNLSITLQSSSTELNQVVVVGYGTQRKKDVTGAVKTVKSEAFNKGIINSPQQLLQGKVSGVNVTSVSGEPGAIQGITIRGPGGVRTGNTPLFVVDGLPLDNAATSGVGDPLNFLNSADIESIDVLKDASGTAIYGSRGANGVIFITTKKGKAGVAAINFASTVGFSSLARKLPVLTADEFKTEVPKLGGTLDNGGTSTDWQSLITRNALSQNYNLSMSGGAEKLTYYASFGMQKQEGIIKANSLDRYTGRINVTQKLWDDKLIIDANLSYGATNNKRPPITGMIGDAITNNPTYAATDAAGKYIPYTAFNNPLLNIELDKEITTVNRLLGSITTTLRLAKGLSYKLNFGIDNSTSTRDVEALPAAVPVRIGRLDTYNGVNRNTLVENYLTYNWAKNKHNFSAL